MHIDLDAFFVSVEQAANPRLRNRPVVVGGRPDRRGVVAAASYEARSFGIHSAMPLITAQRLCPQAIFIEGSFARYGQASLKFMAILADFSPFIEPVGIDEAYLEVTGFESLHGSLRRMGEKIRRRIKDELSITASIGIANAKVVAKIASEQAKPDGLVEVATGEEAAFLKPLAIGRLPGIGKKTERIFRDLGISTIGKLASMPPSALKGRLGAYGDVLHSYARGLDSRRVELPAEAKSISRETTFGTDTWDKAFLEATLRYLSEKVGAKLRQRDRQAHCVALKLRYADFTTLTRRQSLSQATDSDQVIFSTGLKLMRKTLGQQKQAVRLIGIGVSGFCEAARQLDMLDTQAARQEILETTIDRIRRKYGFAAIQTGRTLKLKDIFGKGEGGYKLTTPSLSR